jgi:hypothetical protein
MSKQKATQPTTVGGGGGVDEEVKYIVLKYGACTQSAIMLDTGTVFTQAEYEFNDVHIADLLEHNVIERVGVTVTKPDSQETVTKDAPDGGGIAT